MEHFSRCTCSHASFNADTWISGGKLVQVLTKMYISVTTVSECHMQFKVVISAMYAFYDFSENRLMYSDIP